MAKASEPKQGDVLAGKYRIDKPLGKGGMGMVFVATDTALRRQVAVKMLLPSLAVEPDSVARFMREARACVALTSDHSVRLYDVLETSDGTPFIVMEYLVGHDLGTVVETRGRVKPAEAVDMLLQAIEAIAEAHACGIIHRDLKPQNLFLVKRAEGQSIVKVLDFGLAKVPVDGEKLTASEAVMGSPEYMSPEQMRGAKFVDTRTDIWALGVCLYELLTGRPPWTAPSVPDLVVKILQTPALSPSRVYADIPEALGAIVLRCLEKDVEARFADVAELSRALEDFGTGSSAGAGARARRLLDTARPRVVMSPVKPGRVDERPHVDTMDMALAATEPKLDLDSAATRKQSNRLWSAIGASALAGAALGAVLIVYGTRHHRTSPAPAPVTRAPEVAPSAATSQSALPTPAAMPTLSAVPSTAPIPVASAPERVY